VAASFATNAHDEQDAQAGKVPPGGAKKDAGRQRIIVVASVVGVLIAYLTLKKSSSSAPVGSTASMPVPVSSGVVASGGGGGGQQTASLDTYLQNLTQQITASNTALQSALAPTLGSALPPPLASAPAPYAGVFDSADTNTIRNDQTGEIFQVQQQGLLHLTPATYAALGKPTPLSHFEGAARTSEWTNFSAQTATPATTPTPALTTHP
jgi:hypothetical protein